MPDDLRSNGKYLRSVLDAIPSVILIVDRDLCILDANREAARVLGPRPDLLLRRLCGEVLDCLHASTHEGGCGSTPFCNDCVIRRSVAAVCDGAPMIRRAGQMRIHKAGKTQEPWFLVTAASFAHEGQELVLLVLEDVTELVELRRIVPMCANCRKVRDDQDFWQRVEDYLEKHTSVQFSHGLCPECLRELHPDLADEIADPPSPPDDDS